MENKYLLLLILSVSFISVQCSFDKQDEFINSSFYESFSSPKENFQLFHNNPTGPRFLLLNLTTKYYSEDGFLLEIVRRNYQLKQIYEPYKSSFEISLMNKKFSNMLISGYIYLYYDESPLATFMYHINNKFTPLPLKLVSTRNTFALFVQFSTTTYDKSIEYNINSEEVKSYLLSIPKDELICVITDNNQKLILYPKYISTKPYGLITRVKVEYIKNGNIVDSNYYAAFGCQKIGFKPIERVFLIKDGDKFDIHIKVFYRKLHTPKMDTEVTGISILNGDWVNLDEIEYLLENTQKFFLIKSHMEIQDCENKKNYDISISDSGKKYFAKKFEIVKQSFGVKRVKWSFYFPNEICPNEK